MTLSKSRCIEKVHRVNDLINNKHNETKINIYIKKMFNETDL